MPLQKQQISRLKYLKYLSQPHSSKFRGRVIRKSLLSTLIQCLENLKASSTFHFSLSTGLKAILVMAPNFANCTLKIDTLTPKILEMLLQQVLFFYIFFYATGLVDSSNYN